MRRFAVRYFAAFSLPFFTRLLRPPPFYAWFCRAFTHYLRLPLPRCLRLRLWVRYTAVCVCAQHARCAVYVFCYLQFCTFTAVTTPALPDCVPYAYPLPFTVTLPGWLRFTRCILVVPAGCWFGCGCYYVWLHTTAFCCTRYTRRYLPGSGLRLRFGLHICTRVAVTAPACGSTLPFAHAVPTLRLRYTHAHACTRLVGYSSPHTVTLRYGSVLVVVGFTLQVGYYLSAVYTRYLLRYTPAGSVLRSALLRCPIYTPTFCCTVRGSRTPHQPVYRFTFTVAGCCTHGYGSSRLYFTVAAQTPPVTLRAYAAALPWFGYTAPHYVYAQFTAVTAVVCGYPVRFCPDFAVPLLVRSRLFVTFTFTFGWLFLRLRLPAFCYTVYTLLLQFRSFAPRSTTLYSSAGSCSWLPRGSATHT